jgi:hypothetical protein
MKAQAFTALALLAGLALAGCDSEPTNTVEYYKTNGDARTAKIHECSENPGEAKLKPNCDNAKRALNELVSSPDNKKVPVIR